MGVVKIMQNINSTSNTQVSLKDSKDKYKVFSAIGPAIRAIKYNVGLVCLGMVIIVVIQVLQLLLSKAFITPSVATEGPVYIPYWAFLAYIPFIIVGMFVGIFMTLVIADGAHQEKESLRTYVRAALRLFGRMLLSYFVAGLGILLPVIGLVIIVGACVAIASLSDTPALQVISVILAFVGGIGAFIWALATYIRYSLVGFVAMFEPALPVSLTPKRSRQLLEGTGEWFVFKLAFLGTFVMFVLVLPMLFFVLKAPPIQQQTIFQTYFNLVSIPFSVFTNAMLITLYLNRQATKPALETIQSSKRSWKIIILIVLSVAGAIFLLFSAPSLIKQYNFRQQQNRAQQAAKQKAIIEDNLIPFINKAQGYSLKVPKDFALAGTNPETGDILRSKSAATPFIVLVQNQPKDISLVYINDAASSSELEDGYVKSFDDALQKLSGSPDSTMVSGNINIVGTSHKRAIFAKAQTIDPSGQRLNMHVIFIPRNDGTALAVSVLGLPNEDQQLEPIIDIIFNSISLQP